MQALNRDDRGGCHHETGAGRAQGGSTQAPSPACTPGRRVSAVGWVPGARTASGAPDKVSCLSGAQGPAWDTATLLAFGAEEQPASRRPGQVIHHRPHVHPAPGDPSTEGTERWPTGRPPPQPSWDAGVQPSRRQEGAQHHSPPEGHLSIRPEGSPVGGGAEERLWLDGHGSRSLSSAQRRVVDTHTQHTLLCSLLLITVGASCN